VALDDQRAVEHEDLIDEPPVLVSVVDRERADAHIDADQFEVE